MTENRPPNSDPSAIQAHLAMMQGVINRMAVNSRSCKVWCVTLVAAVLVLVTRTGEPQHVLLAVVPTLLFWILDSYYLALERAFIESQNVFVEKLHQGELESSDVYRVVWRRVGFLQVGRRLFGSVSTWPFYLFVAATVVLAWLFILPSATATEALP